VAQLEDSLRALDGPDLDEEELAEIDRYAATSAGVDLWSDSSQR
jgi:hypothetical protein